MKTFLEQHFDYDSNQCSPVQPDYDRVVSYDEDGNEFIKYVPVDYPSIQSRNGTCTDWSLNNLLKAGINPDFGIMTGNPTRLEGLSSIDSFERAADVILNDVKSE